MGIIYTCPKCGADLQVIVLASDPPQDKYECIKCGWSHCEGPRYNETIRVPYPDNGENIMHC